MRVYVGNCFFRIINGAPPKSLESSCNTACSCPFNAFDPVCGVNGITYYSPCFASCHSKGTGVDHVSNQLLPNNCMIVSVVSNIEL